MGRGEDIVLSSADARMIKIPAYHVIGDEKSARGIAIINLCDTNYIMTSISTLKLLCHVASRYAGCQP
jgi:hypothetical protein